MYHVLIERRARKGMRRLPKDVLRSVDRAVQALQAEPRPRGCRKIRGRENAWRIVVRKDYRVLYTVDDEAQRVEVYDVGRRGKDTYD